MSVEEILIWILVIQKNAQKGSRGRLSAAKPGFRRIRISVFERCRNIGTFDSESLRSHAPGLRSCFLVPAFRPMTIFGVHENRATRVTGRPVMYTSCISIASIGYARLRRIKPNPPRARRQIVAGSGTTAVTVVVLESAS